MSSITFFFRIVIVLIVLRAVLSSLLPDGNMKKYVDFVIGLIIIYMLVSPLYRGDFKDLIIISDISEQTDNYDKIYENGLIREYKKNLENNIKERFDISDVDVTVDASYRVISVDTHGEKQKQAEEYLGL